MILTMPKEELHITSHLGNEKCGNLKQYVDMADSFISGWEDEIAVADNKFPLSVTANQTMQYKTSNGFYRDQDMSSFSFGQACSKIGIPANFATKLLTHGHGELAVQTFDELAGDFKSSDNEVLVRRYNGVDRGYLTTRYNVFNSSEVLHGIQDALSDSKYDGKYDLNQIYLSEERLHARFVAFNNPIKVGKEELIPGFTVTSSDVGRSSLNIKYFIYRAICKNGIVFGTKYKGLLFRQSHLANFDIVASSLFKNALADIDELNIMAQQKLESARTRILTGEELEFFMTKAQKELHMARDNQMDGIKKLLDETYTGGNVLSFVHAITENAQKYTLDTREDHESWAGNLLLKMA